MSSDSRLKRNPLRVSLYGATAKLIEKETYSTGTSFAFPGDTTECERDEDENNIPELMREKNFCFNGTIDGCAWLDFFTSCIIMAYSMFLIWLLANVKGEPKYYYLSFIPFFLIAVWSFFPCCYDKRVALYIQQLRMVGVVAVLMSTFTMLSRTAFYYHDHKPTIGSEFVIMSLKCSIFVFIWAILACIRFRPLAIIANRHTIILLILDNCDIFNLIETLSQDRGLGKCISENSSLENVIQVFGTLSFVILWLETSLGKAVNESKKTFKPTVEEFDYNRSTYNIIVQWISLLFNNIPFLVIRIIVWVNYDVYNICFMAKNVIFIICCIVEMRFSALAGHGSLIVR